MGLDHLVLRPGGLVTGWGRICATADGVWLDPGGWYAWPDDEHAPSRHAVRLIGAEASVVATGTGPDGSIPGWGTVTGVWSGDAIAVRHQSPHRPPARLRGVWTRPPCPAPAGGWPTDQLDRAHAVLIQHLHDWTISSVGHSADQDGHAVVGVDLLRVRPEMAEWAVDVPDGLLQVHPVLTPAAH